MQKCEGFLKESMLEIKYKKGKLLRYNIIIGIFVLAMILLTILLILEQNYFLSAITFLLFLIGLITQIYLFKTFNDKWIVRFNEVHLITNKSLCGLIIPRSEIIAIEGYYQQGSYYQIGIKIKNIEVYYKDKSYYDKFHLKMNKIFTKYNLLIPGYMIEGNPEDICRELNEILAYE